jgi:hypothetical protein
VSRPAYAKALLQAVRDKKIQSSEITAYHARQIRSFENEALTKDLTELWGDVRVTAAEKKTLIDQYKSQLTSDSLKKADLSAGRAMFQKTCANCHVLTESVANLAQTSPDRIARTSTTCWKT